MDGQDANFKSIEDLLTRHGNTTIDSLLLDLQAFRIIAEYDHHEWRQTLLGAMLISGYKPDDFIPLAKDRCSQARTNITSFMMFEARILALLKENKIQLKEETLKWYDERNETGKDFRHQEIRRELEEIRKQLTGVNAFLKRTLDVDERSREFKDAVFAAHQEGNTLEKDQ